MTRYRINRERRLVSLRGTGEQTLEEWRVTLEAMITECPEVLTFDSITDGRDTRVVMSASHVHDLVELNKRMGVQEHPRRAVHLIASKAAFGVSRMYELLTEGDSMVNRLTTDSIDAAADWLGRPAVVIRAELEALAGN